MAKRRRYTDKFRADAVLMLEAAGYPEMTGALTAVADKLGIHYQTLSRWANGKRNPPPHEMVQEKKRALVDELESLAYQLVAAMGGRIGDDDASLRDMATTFGIVVDKWQLLQAKPTAILKLQQAIERGYISAEDVRQRYPSLASQFFEDARRTADA